MNKEEIIKNISFSFNSELLRSEAIYNNDLIGKCEVEIDNNKWYITHTIVNELFGGMGIAKKLVQIIVEEARRNNIKIIPICSYAKKMLENEEYKDILG